MLPELNQTPELSKETKRLLADMGGSKYFDALKELAEIEFTNMAISQLLTRGLPEAELRHFQGYTDGIIQFLLRIKQIAQEGYKDIN